MVQTKSRNIRQDRLVTTLGGMTVSTDKLRTRQTRSTSYTDCHISPQTTPCTTERQPTSHQERTPHNVLYSPDSNATADHLLLHCTLCKNIRTSSTNDAQHALLIHQTTAQNTNISNEQSWQDCRKSWRIRNVKRLLEATSFVGETLSFRRHVQSQLMFDHRIEFSQAFRVVHRATLDWEPMSSTALSNWCDNLYHDSR